MAKKTEEKKEEALYSKEQLVTSKKFRNHADLVNALLKDEQSYSISEVEAMIANYMKGQVN